MAPSVEPPPLPRRSSTTPATDRTGRSRSRRMARVSASPRSSRMSWMATTIASPSPNSTRSTGSSSSSGVARPASRSSRRRCAVEREGRTGVDVAGVHDDRLGGRTRVGRGEGELLGLLVAQPGRRHAREREHHVAVGERRRRARLDPEADGGALGLLPEPRRGMRLEVDLVDARLLVERRPRPVRIDGRHVRADGRGQDDARPAVLVQVGEVARASRRRRRRAPPRRAGPRRRPTRRPEHGRELACRARDRGPLERGRGLGLGGVLARRAVRPRVLEDRPQLVDPGRRGRRPGRARPGSFGAAPPLEVGEHRPTPDGRTPRPPASPARRSRGRRGPASRRSRRPAPAGRRAPGVCESCVRACATIARAAAQAERGGPPAGEAEGMGAGVVGRRGLGRRVPRFRRCTVQVRSPSSTLEPPRRARRRGRVNPRRRAPAGAPAGGCSPPGAGPKPDRQHAAREPNAAPRHRVRKGSRGPDPGRKFVAKMC